MRLIKLAIILSLFSFNAFSAPKFPELTGRVVDEANILSPETEANLTAILAAHEEQTSEQIVVATIPSLEGENIESYANQLFRQWQLGQKDKNNGILLLAAPNEREVRIEVGYGLEGKLTDALSSHIINSMILPNFKNGDMESGINIGIQAILNVLNGNQTAQSQPANITIPANQDNPPVIDMTMIWILLGVLIFYFILKYVMKKWIKPATEDDFDPITKTFLMIGTLSAAVIFVLSMILFTKHGEQLLPENYFRDHSDQSVALLLICSITFTAMCIFVFYLIVKLCEKALHHYGIPTQYKALKRKYPKTFAVLETVFFILRIIFEILYFAAIIFGGSKSSGYGSSSSFRGGGGSSGGGGASGRW